MAAVDVIPRVHEYVHPGLYSNRTKVLKALT